MSEYSPDDLMDARDRQVLAELGRVVRQVDPVPDGLADRSLFALTLAALLGGALLNTLRVTLLPLACATVLGVAIAFAFVHSRTLEAALRCAGVTSPAASTRWASPSAPGLSPSARRLSAASVSTAVARGSAG